MSGNSVIIVKNVVIVLKNGPAQRNTEYGSKTAKFVYFLKVCLYLRTVRADLAFWPRGQTSLAGLQNHKKS
jgi:hypothetical protein